MSSTISTRSAPAKPAIPHRVVQLYAVGQRLVDLPGVGRHLVAALQADHVHPGGSEPARAARGVDRDVAAADHDDLLAGQLGGRPQLDLPQEGERARDSGELLARDAETGRDGCAGRDEHCVVAVAPERIEIVDARVSSRSRLPGP